MTKYFSLLFSISFVILSSLLSCSSDTSKASLLENTKVILITNHIDVELISKNKFGSWTPKTEDFYQIQSIIDNAIKDDQFDFLKKTQPEIINDYYRQYVCYFNEKKERMVYVNAFCKIIVLPETTDNISRFKAFDWKNRILITHHQSNFCYWNIKINLSTGKYKF